MEIGTVKGHIAENDGPVGKMSRLEVSNVSTCGTGLNEQCLKEVFSYLALKDLLLRTSLVNRFWKNCSDDSLPDAVDIRSFQPEALCIELDKAVFHLLCLKKMHKFYAAKTYQNNRLLSAITSVRIISPELVHITSMLLPHKSDAAPLIPFLSSVTSLAFPLCSDVRMMRQYVSLFRSPTILNSIQHICFDTMLWKSKTLNPKISFHLRAFLLEVSKLNHIECTAPLLCQILIDSSENGKVEPAAVAPMHNVLTLSLTEADGGGADGWKRAAALALLFPNVSRVNYGCDNGWSHNLTLLNLAKFTNLKELKISGMYAQPNPKIYKEDLPTLANVEILTVEARKHLHYYLMVLRIVPNVRKLCLDFKEDYDEQGELIVRTNVVPNVQIDEIFVALEEIAPFASKMWRNLTDLEIHLPRLHSPVQLLKLIVDLMQNNAPLLERFTLGKKVIESKQLRIFTDMVRFLGDSQFRQLKLKLVKWPNGDDAVAVLRDLVKTGYAGKSLRSIGVEFVNRPISEQIRKLWDTLAELNMKGSMLDPKNVKHPCKYIKLFGARQRGADSVVDEQSMKENGLYFYVT